MQRDDGSEALGSQRRCMPARIGQAF